jgi:hypothetical protein
VFWLSIAAIAIGLVSVVFRATSEWGRAAPSVILGLGIAVVLIAAVGGGFALSVASRMRAVAANLPGAIRIPIVVGSTMAAATAQLAGEQGDDSVRLRQGSYAAVAVDAAGLHLISNASRPFGLVPAASVGVAGLGRTLMGSREMDAIMLTVTTAAGSMALPLVPMRLHGNPLRALKVKELNAVMRQLDDALGGRGIVQPGWAY